jgi:hypothetical protein
MFKKLIIGFEVMVGSKIGIKVSTPLPLKCLECHKKYFCKLKIRKTDLNLATWAFFVIATHI